MEQARIDPDALARERAAMPSDKDAVQVCPSGTLYSIPHAFLEKGQRCPSGSADDAIASALLGFVKPLVRALVELLGGCICGNHL
jgi:hypothetical protein